MSSFPLMPLWAVHISDGVLTWPWLVAGFLIAAIAALLASWRVRDEEIPRIALLTAAFFVASLVHFPVFLGSVHLLLNGLVGVILGRRAPLAILVGLSLQAVLIGHGGFTTIGINTCVMSLPAVGMGMVFRAVLRHPAVRDHLEHSLVWGLLFGMMVGFVVVLLTIGLDILVLYLGGAVRWSVTLLLVFLVAHLPVALIEGLVLGFTFRFLVCVKPELLGLEVECEEDFYKGQPLAEEPASTVLSSQGGLSPLPASPLINQQDSSSVYPLPTPSGESLELPVSPTSPEGPRPGTLFLLALLMAGWFLTSAQAHSIQTNYRVLPDGRVQVEAWYDGDVPATKATVEVYDSKNHSIHKGQLNGRGMYTFTPTRVEKLRVVITGSPGHRTQFNIPQSRLAQSSPGDTDPKTNSGASLVPPRSSPLPHPARFSSKDILLGITFLLAVSAFILGIRNTRRIQRCQPGGDGNPEFSQAQANLETPLRPNSPEQRIQHK